jgi:hypothetical protein
MWGRTTGIYGGSHMNLVAELCVCFPNSNLASWVLTNIANYAPFIVLQDFCRPHLQPFPSSFPKPTLNVLNHIIKYSHTNGPIFLCQLFVTLRSPTLWQYIQHHQLPRREDDLGSTFQRFKSIVSWLNWFLSCSEEEHYGREYVVEQTSQLIVFKKQKSCFYNQSPSPIPFKLPLIKWRCDFSSENMAVRKAVRQHI